MAGKFFRRIRKPRLEEEENKEGGYQAPKPAHRWQRRRRMEEEADKKRKEYVTNNKVNPWFQCNSNSRGQDAVVLYPISGELNKGDLKCRVGDKLLIETWDRNDAWWEAINERTGIKGFIPANYVTDEPGVEDVLDAWHDIDRRDCEAKLSMKGLPIGTYILRPSSNPLRIALSVLCEVGSTTTIKHFKITDDSGVGGFFINPSTSFRTLDRLVTYYKDSGPSPLLTLPWPRSPPVLQSRELYLPRDDLDVKERVSRGGYFGSIYTALHIPEKQIVALSKISSSSSCLGGMDQKGIEEIVENAKRLHHPSLVHYIGLCEDARSDSLLLVSEYMLNGTLLDHLEADQEIPYEQLLKFLFQITDGMDYLENMQSIHGDLRCANVHLGDEFTAKIANFALNPHKADNNAGISYKKAIVRWAAPELQRPHYAFDIPADIWSFGVVMFEVLTRGSQPYKGMEPTEIISKITAGYRLPSPTTYGYECEKSVYDMMRSCWYADPGDRPTFRDLWFFFDDRLNKDKDIYAEL